MTPLCVSYRQRTHFPFIRLSFYFFFFKGTVCFSESGTMDLYGSYFLPPSIHSPTMWSNTLPTLKLCFKDGFNIPAHVCMLCYKIRTQFPVEAEINHKKINKSILSGVFFFFFTSRRGILLVSFVYSIIMCFAVHFIGTHLNWPVSPNSGIWGLASHQMHSQIASR